MLTDGKDIFSDPSYIVLNVPSPVADQLRHIRSFFDPPRAKMSVEITLCGSNGRGTISPGQSPDAVFAEIDAIARQTEPFNAKFSHVKRFPDTGIFYYPLHNPEPFEILHSMCVQSKIQFEPTEFPYEPHCTIRLGQHSEYTKREIMAKLEPPDEDFIIDTMSVYSLTQNQQIPKLLHRINLG